MLKKFSIVLLITICFCSCTNTSKNKQNLKIQINNETINYFEVKEDNEGIFTEIFEKNNLKSIKDFKVGEKIILDFGNNIPDKLTIKETLLILMDIEKIPLKKKWIFYIFSENDKITFKIQKNLATALDSHYEQIKNTLEVTK